MRYNELLAREWEAIDQDERRKALHDAHQAGYEAAEAGIIGSGGSKLVDSDYCLESLYWERLIKDEEFRRGLDIEDRELWREMSIKNYLDDPRVRCFCTGWSQFMIEEKWEREEGYVDREITREIVRSGPSIENIGLAWLWREAILDSRSKSKQRRNYAADMAALRRGQSARM
jgi:hypothetical protein